MLRTTDKEVKNWSNEKWPKKEKLKTTAIKHRL